MSMPAPPPDTRAPGQTGHIADHNTMSDAIASLETAVQTLENTIDGVGIALPAGDLGGTAEAPIVEKIQGQAINASPGGDTAFLRADGTWDVPPGTGGGGGGGGGDGTVTSVSGETANGFVVSVNEETTTPQITVGTDVSGLMKGDSGAAVAAVPDTDYLAPTGSGSGLTGLAVSQVSGAAPLASPVFTGTPEVPTASSGANDTQAASTAFAKTAAAAAQTAAEAASLPLPTGGTYPGGSADYLRADGTWDVPPGTGGGSGTVTAVSVATANGFAGTVANPTTTPAITVSTNVSGLLKGNGTAVAAATAGTDYVAPTGSGAALTGLAVSQVSGAAPLASPALTGSPTAPTQTSGDNSTKLATTSFVSTAIAAIGGGGALLQPTGTHAGDAAAINAILSVINTYTYGGTVDMAAGIWRLTVGDIAAITRSGITFRWQPNSCVLGAGSGDLLRMYDFSTYGSRVAQGGGILGNPVFDGSAMSGTSSFLHASDIFKFQCEMDPQNLTTGSSIAVHYNNIYYFMERGRGRINATNCVNAVVFDVNGNSSVGVQGTVTGSYYRGDYEIYADTQNAAYNGVVWRAGAFMINGKFTKWGNYTGSGSLVTPGSALTFTGQTPAGALSPSYSALYTSHFQVGCECDQLTYNPMSINFGNGNNVIGACFGGISFNGGFAASNSVNSLNQFNGWSDEDNLPSWTEQGSTNTFLGAPQAISGTSPDAVTNMTAPLYGYVTMQVSARIPYTSTATSGAPKFTFTGGGTQAKTSLAYEFWSGTTLVSSGEVTDYTAVITGPTLTSSASLQLRIRGSIMNESAATLQLMAYEGTSGDGFSIDYAAYITSKPLSN